MHFHLKYLTRFIQNLGHKKTAISKIAVSNEQGSSHERWSHIQRKGPVWKEGPMKMEKIPRSTQRNLPVNFYPVGTDKCGPFYTRFVGVHWRNFFWNVLGINYTTTCQHHMSAVKNLSSHLATIDGSRSRNYGPDYAETSFPCAASDLIKILPKFRDETGFANNILNEVQTLGFWAPSEPRQSVSRDEFQDLSLDPGSADQRPDSPVSSLLTMKSNTSKKEPLWFRNESERSKLCQGRKMDVFFEEVKNRNILVLQWLFENYQSNDEDQEVTKEPRPSRPESYLISSAWSSPASLSDDSGYSEILSCPENHLLESEMTEVWLMTVCVDDMDRPASPFSSCPSQTSDWSTDELPVFTNEPGH